MKTLEKIYNDTSIVETLKNREFRAPSYLHEKIEQEIIVLSILCPPISCKINEEAFDLIALSECDKLKSLAHQYRCQIKIQGETNSKTVKIPKALTQDVSNKLTAAAITVNKRDLAEERV